jgi:serine/threonine protein kinase
VPFKASNISDLHKLILAGEFEFPVDTVSEEVKDLIRKMLVVKPEDRINIPQMLNHPWVIEVDKAFETEDYGDEEHDLKVGSTFFRQEVMGGLISGANSHNGNTNGNINFINVENLYYRGGLPVENQPTKVDEKVTYSDYCALTEDFMTYRIDEDAMEIVTGFGYPRAFVIDSINKGDINHATTSYYLLIY